MSLLLHKPNANDLNFIKSLVETGKLQPVIDKMFPLSQTADAIRYYADGRARGKVIITVAHNTGT